MENATSIKRSARQVGITYLVMAIVMTFSFMVIPSMYVVSGNAAATARNIMEGELLYRLGIFGSVLSHVTFIFVVLMLYNLFRDVDRRLALLMVVVVSVGVAAELVNLVNRAAPLVLLRSDSLSALTRPQLEALSFSFLRLNHALGQQLVVLWGLWLIPFGRLVIKSNWFPKILGILLYIAGSTYMVSCLLYLMFPAQMTAISSYLFPLYMGELGIVFWMAIMGAKVPQTERVFA